MYLLRYTGCITAWKLQYKPKQITHTKIEFESWRRRLTNAIKKAPV
jgi:hypothetical protein